MFCMVSKCDHIYSEKYSLRVSKNILVRKLSGPNSGDVIEGWSNLQNEKLHDLYVWRNTIRVIKPGRMRWTGHVICTREEEDAYKVLAVNLKNETALKAAHFSLFLQILTNTRFKTVKFHASEYKN